MELSRRADYGTRLILDLALQPPGSRVPVHEIAARHSVPLPFMKKIASQLAAAGFVDAVPGPKGGVRLLHPAHEITLLDVVETVDGPLYLNRCLVEPRACPYDKTCPVHEVWVQAQTQLVDLLRQTTFSDLAARAREREREATS